MGTHEPTPSVARLTTGAVASLVGGELVGPADLSLTGISSLDESGPGSITFIRSAAFAQKWSACRATAALVTRGIAVPGHEPAKRVVIYVPDADAAVIAVLRAFAPPTPRPAPGVHPSAVVDAGASVDPAASIGPLCVVASGSRIGAGVCLVASVTIGAGASIGADTVIHPGTVVGDRCTIGAACILQPGVKIGADGFGYAPSPDGRGIVKIPHIGTVVVGDHVEIGANTCIDRAKFGATSIGDGTKIDNLVQIGHNCRVGKCCLICGQTGLAGSVTLGDGVILAGDVGVADNLTIGAGARVAARSGVMNDIPAGESWLGAPAQPIREGAMNVAIYRDLARHIRELRRGLKAEVPGP